LLSTPCWACTPCVSRVNGQSGSPWEGRIGGRKVASYPICGEPTKTVTDWDALSAAHPDLVAQFTRTEPVEQERRLILSKEFTQE
jgi:hypothetical protein